MECSSVRHYIFTDYVHVLNLIGEVAPPCRCVSYGLDVDGKSCKFVSWAAEMYHAMRSSLYDGRANNGDASWKQASHIRPASILACVPELVRYLVLRDI